MQTEMEKIMYQINDILLHRHVDVDQWQRIKLDLEHKINIHRERGEWK